MPPPPVPQRERPKPRGTLKAYSHDPLRNQTKLLVRGRKRRTTARANAGVARYLLPTLIEQADESSRSASRSASKSASKSVSKSPPRAGALLPPSEVPEYVQVPIDRHEDPLKIINMIMARTGIDSARKTELVRHVLAVYTPEYLGAKPPTPPRRPSAPARLSPPRRTRAGGRGGFLTWLFGH